MLDPARLGDMETELTRRTVSVAEVCRRAKVDPTTWWRWKSGKFFPSYKAAQAVQRAYDEIIEETGGAHETSHGSEVAGVQGDAA